MARGPGYRGRREVMGNYWGILREGVERRYTVVSQASAKRPRHKDYQMAATEGGRGCACDSAMRTVARSALNG
jgi:hypothetical protein